MEKIIKNGENEVFLWKMKDKEEEKWWLTSSFDHRLTTEVEDSILLNPSAAGGSKILPR